MNVWWERMVLVAAVLFAVPALFASAAFGLLPLLAIPFEAIVAFVVYARMRDARLRDARLARTQLDTTPRPDRRPPVAPVDAAAIASLPEPVRACPECAYVGVRMPEIGDGLWPGGGELGDRIVCPRCGYQGIAVLFERREEYGAHLRDLAGQGAGQPA